MKSDFPSPTPRKRLTGPFYAAKNHRPDTIRLSVKTATIQKPTIIPAATVTARPSIKKSGSISEGLR